MFSTGDKPENEIGDDWYDVNIYVVKWLQYKKAEFSIVHVDGNVTVSRLEHPWNAFDPIDKTLSGIIISCKLVHS